MPPPPTVVIDDVTVDGRDNPAWLSAWQEADAKGSLRCAKHELTTGGVVLFALGAVIAVLTFPNALDFLISVSGNAEWEE